MTKDEFKKVLMDAIGGNEFGDQAVAHLMEHYDEKGKYAQTVQDRLDERLGSLNGWEKKHREEGEIAKADEEASKIAILEKLDQALKTIED